MNVSRPFILRPIATFLVSVAILLAGTLAFRFLAVSPLPQIDTPTIVVRASLAGASPETMAATVATPLERALGQVAGITELTSHSSQGSSTVIMQFELSREINGAARDVQAAINAARSLLPSAMRTLPSYRKANPSDAPILMLALTSERLGRGELYDLASSKLSQHISRVNGVGEVQIRGGALPSVRIDVRPHELSAKGIGIEQLRSAVREASTNTPTGVIAGEDGNSMWIASNGQLSRPEQFRDLILRFQDGASVRLGDVANVYQSVQNVYSSGYFNNRSSVTISVTRQAGTNIVATIDAIKAELPALNEMLPEGTQLILSVDRSQTIRQALLDTEESLILATILVIVVVYVFLGRARAVIIPAVALPISLVGTFAVMYLFGYSLNALSMMALIVSTGFVVDDAIVVLENIERHIAEGLTPLQAALRGSREIGFTVLSMTASLIAVFIPLFFMQEVVGRLLREFAVTLSVSLLVSMFVSLTLTPMLCSRMLRAATPEASRGGFFHRLTAAYRSSLCVVMRHKTLTLLVLCATIALNGYLYVKVDKGLFPNQDNGMLMGFVRTDRTTSFQTMDRLVMEISRRIQADPAVRYVSSSTGGSGFGLRNSGSFFITLKDASERKEPSSVIANRLTRVADGLPVTRLMVRAQQDLRAGGREANADYQFSLQCDDLTKLREWAPKVFVALRGLKELTSVDSDAEAGATQAYLTIDREAASRLGVSVRDIVNVLGDSFAQRDIASTREMLNQYYTILDLDARYTEDPTVLDRLYLISSDGQRIPLSRLMRVSYRLAPQSVAHQSQMATATIAFNLADSVSLEQATQAIERTVVGLGLPSEFRTGLQGTARMYQKIVSQLPWLIGAALVTIYILLGILYESWIHPVTILSTLPSAGIGALLLMMATGTELTVIAFVGILLLIGIVKKNGILMVDFAISAQKELGLSAEEAILEACGKRLRPILMTTFAAFFGALPLILHTGQNAALNRPLGIAICGGLALSQILTLYTTPVVYVTLDRFGARMRNLLRGSGP